MTHPSTSFGMASDRLLPFRHAPDESQEGYGSDDSMASIKEKGKKKTARPRLDLGKMRRSVHQISDVLEIAKKGVGMDTDDLCTACKKIPFEECVPHDFARGKAEASIRSQTLKPLVYYKSLSEILKCHTFCKFCELLFHSICEPDNDLLKAPHIRDHLPDSKKFKDMRSFADWIQDNPYWKREWLGNAGLWPFGYAVDRDQATSSTLEQARTLFLEAEDRDIKTKSLDMDDLVEIYESTDAIADTMTAANTTLGIIDLATRQKDRKVQMGMAIAQLAMKQLTMLVNRDSKRLPCILMLRAYRKDEEKRGALSVRAYGHGRAPLAPLKEICHFSLRFEDSSIPRISEQQIWYGRTLGPQIDIPFFRHFVEACTSHHDCGELLSNTKDKSGSGREWFEAGSFRLVDVHKMCIVEENFSNMIRSRSSVRYVALSYRWGMLELLKGWKEHKDAQGWSYYHNENEDKVTWTRPDRILLTSENELALALEHSLSDPDIHIPRTIKDAMEVVRSMGERYLWVDQLCILQEGNAADKHANIKRMDHIYNHALFTIVAGDGVHADEGLKGLRGHSARRRQIMEDRIVENARMVLPTRMELNFKSWEERAWCLQEKLLSRRILIFAGGFAVWHCRGGTWREDVNALDGSNSSISFPWLRLTPLSPPSNDMARAGLQTTQEDESVRLFRLPAMHQYIEAVEDLSRRTIGQSADILSAFEGLANILGGPGFLDSPFRKGLPIHFLDVSLLWQSDEPIRRRRDDFNQCPPSWTWAGWEAAQTVPATGSPGALVRFEEPFDVLMYDSGTVRRYRKSGEERIRPRKGTFYGVQETQKVKEIQKTQKPKASFSLQELGLFGKPSMQAKGFMDWDSSQARPAPKPRLNIALETLSAQHLIVNTEVATLQLGDDCWRVRTTTKRADTEHCILTFHDTEPIATLPKVDATTQPDMKIETVVLREHWVEIGTHARAGIVKFDTAYHAKRVKRVTAILLSEAQYLGNEATLDVLGYPLYNIMLVQTIDEKGGVEFQERIGLGKIYKYAWREAGARKEVVVLE
jgi:hypothetical protein